MVEKTKKALGILQERGLTDSNFPDWNRKKSTEEVLAQTVRHTEERIESIKKKAGKTLVKTNSGFPISINTSLPNVYLH